MCEDGLSGLVAGAREVLHVDVHALGDDALMSDALGLAEAISLLDAALAHRLARLDADGTCEHLTGLATRSWFARDAHLPRRRADRSLSLGRGLRDLPVIAAAVADGRLTADHAVHLARKMNARVADAIAELQDKLVAEAADCRFETWAQQVTSSSNCSTMTAVTTPTATSPTTSSPSPPASTGSCT